MNETNNAIESQQKSLSPSKHPILIFLGWPWISLLTAEVGGFRFTDPNGKNNPNLNPNHSKETNA